jgi:hypothetical protein
MLTYQRFLLDRSIISKAGCRKKAEDDPIANALGPLASLLRGRTTDDRVGSNQLRNQLRRVQMKASAELPSEKKTPCGGIVRENYAEELCERHPPTFPVSSSCFATLSPSRSF